MPIVQRAQERERTEHDVRRGFGRPQPANREWTASSCCVKFRARLLALAGAAIVAMVIVLALGHDAALDRTPVRDPSTAE